MVDVGRSMASVLVRAKPTPVALIVALGLLDLPFPYLPQQVTLLNWLVIGIPALVIALRKERSAGATRGYDHPGSGPCQTPGRGLTDARRGAGNNDNLMGQCGHRY